MILLCSNNNHHHHHHHTGSNQKKALSIKDVSDENNLRKRNYRLGSQGFGG
jgi:hypothetical protein